MEKQTQTEPPLAGPLIFSTNIICPDDAAPGGSRFVPAGTDSPYRSLEAVPPNLRALIVNPDELEPEEENRPRGNFEMGVPYELTDDGRLGRQLRRRVERQVSQLQAEADYQEALEAEAASAELPADVVSDLQAQHESDVARQKAQLEVAARAADAASDAAAAAAEPPQLFVRRGGRHYSPALSARLRAGEEVFMKDPADGSFIFIGTTDSQGGLPDAPITLP